MQYLTQSTVINALSRPATRHSRKVMLYDSPEHYDLIPLDTYTPVLTSMMPKLTAPQD